MQHSHEIMATLMRAGAEGAFAAFHKADRDLHHALFVAARNRRLLTLREALQAQLDVLQVYGLRLEPLFLLSIEHHAAMTPGCSPQGARLAHRRSGAMAWHITEMQARALAIFKEQDV